MDKHTIKLSADEKLLLHLWDYSKYQDQMDVPYTISQEGIAQKIGITQQRVSALGSRLASRGLVETRPSHVHGKDRKLKCYFLTQLGHMECARLKGALEKSGYVDFSDVVPVPKSFFGRDRELGVFKEWLDSSSEKIFVVRGIAGIGKSAFVASAIAPCKGSMNIFWYRFTEWATLRNMLARLGEFLKEGGKESVETYLASKPGVDISEVAMMLSEEMRLMNALLVFDDYQKVQETKEITQFFGALCQFLERMEGVKVVVVGREVPRFYYDAREVNVRRLVRELKLDGLDVDTSYKILAARGIANGRKEMLYKATGGHPLALELVDEQGHYTENQLFDNYLFDEIFAKLDGDEKAILEVAAVFRFPAFPSTYLEIAGISDFQAIYRLEKKSLLQIVDGVADLHDVVRQWLYAQIPRNKRNGYHERTAKHYATEMGQTTQSLAEAIHHYIAGERYRGALDLIFQHAEELIQSSYWEKLLDIILMIPADKLTPREKPAIEYIFGRLYRLQGSFETSATHFKSAIEGYTSLGDRAKEAEMCVEITQSLSEKTEEELGYLVRAKAYFESTQNPLWLGRVERGMAGYYSDKYDAKEALELYHKSLAHFEEAKSTEDIGFTLTSLGGLYSKLRRFEEAIANYKMGLDILEGLKKHHDVARTYMNLGNTYRSMGDVKEALRCYERSRDMATRYYTKRVLGFALANMGEAYTQLGDYDKALECSEKAIEIFRKLEIKRVLAYSYMVNGMALAGRGEQTEAERSFKTALDIYTAGTDAGILAEIHANYGRMLAGRGDTAGAVKELTTARDLWVKANDSVEAQKVVKELSQL